MAGLSELRDHIVVLSRPDVCMNCGRCLATRAFDVQFLVGFKDLGFPRNPARRVVVPMCQPCIEALESFWLALPNSEEVK